jgi:hypothetical protein
MMSRTFALAGAAVVAAVALTGCGGGERKAKADTGTAEATVKTTAPENAVSDSQLQQQAQQAATAASPAVDGSHMNSMTPAGNATASGNAAH